MREPLKRRELTLELLDVNDLVKEIYPLVRNDALIAASLSIFEAGVRVAVDQG